MNKTIKAGLLLSSILVLAACSGEDNKETGVKESTQTEQVGTVTYKGFDPTTHKLGLLEYDEYVGNSEALSELLGDDFLAVDFVETDDITEFDGKPIAEHLADLNYEVSYESAKEITEYSYNFKGLTEDEQDMYLKMVYTQSDLTTSAGTQIISYTTVNAEKLNQFFKDLKEETGINLETFDKLLQAVMVDTEAEDTKKIVDSKAYETFLDGYLLDMYTLDVSTLKTDEAVDAEYEAHRKVVEEKEFTDTIKGADLNYIHDMVNHLRLARIVITSSSKDKMSEEELDVFFTEVAKKEEEARKEAEAAEGATVIDVGEEATNTDEVKKDVEKRMAEEAAEEATEEAAE